VASIVFIYLIIQNNRERDIMETKLIKHGSGIYELIIIGTNESFMIELRADNDYESDTEGYNVTMLENDEPVEFIGVSETYPEAIEYIKTLY